MGQTFDFCACPSRNVVVVERNTSSKKGKLLCCKCIFDRLKLIWPRSSPKPPQCPKFLQKVPGVNGLNPRGHTHIKTTGCLSSLSGVKSCFGIYYGVQPRKVCSGGFCGTGKKKRQEVYDNQLFQ